MPDVIKSKTNTIIFLAVLALMQVGCGYKWGFKDRKLTGGYTEVSVPVFLNRSQEVSVEVDFTNALIEEFARSQVARVVNDVQAPVKVEGVIEKIEYVREGKRVGPAIADRDDAELKNLPTGAVLATNYRVFTTVSVKLVRVSDRKVLWYGKMKDEAVYAAPQLETANLNSANALYNQSARRINLGELAKTMMAEVHDRMTETF